MKVGAAIADIMAREGVDVVFGDRRDAVPNAAGRFRSTDVSGDYAAGSGAPDAIAAAIRRGIAATEAGQRRERGSRMRPGG